MTRRKIGYIQEPEQLVEKNDDLPCENMERIARILQEPKGKLIAVDVDGTLTKSEAWTYDEFKNAEPNREMIAFVNDLYARGAHIVIYTARDHIYYNLTANRLDEYGVRYHGINMQRKPGGDVYLDDKAVNPDNLF